MTGRSLLFLILFALLVPVFALSQTPVFVTQKPITGNSANSFFVFLPMANIGKGDATDVHLTSVALDFMGSAVAPVTQPSAFPFKTGSGYLGAGGVRVLGLEFENSSLVSGNTYSVRVTGTYQVNGATRDFTLKSLPLVYRPGFSGTHEDVLDAIGMELDSLPGLDRMADDRELLTFIQGLPQISEAGLGNPATTVWARFADNGERIVVLNNVLPSRGEKPLSDNEVTEPALAPPRIPLNYRHGQAISMGAAPADSGPTEMPKSGKARVLNALSSSFENPVPNIQKWLMKQGYSQVTGADASVASLRGVGGDGIFYISSHGGVDEDGNYPFNIWTATPTTNNPDRQLQDDICPDPPACDLKNARIVDVVAADHKRFGILDWVSVHHYGITANFINKYWDNFGDNALVFIDICDSNVNDPSVTDFKDAIFAKLASVYVGWSGTVDSAFSANAARLVFDRLLGANQFCPEDGQPCHPGAAQPPVFAQRPFDYTEVQQDLHEHHLDKDGFTEISFISNPYVGTNFGLLAPTISYLFMDEITNDNVPQLTIYGDFGSDPRPDGWVTVGGTTNDGFDIQGGAQVPIASWDKDRIVVNLPLSGEGSAGNVQVTVRRHRSNVAQLTEWRSDSFMFTEKEGGSLQQQTIYNLHLRTDIRKYRDSIHFPPSKQYIFLASANDSTADFMASGQARGGGGLTYTGSGQGSLANGMADGGANDTLILGQQGTDDGHITFALSAVSTNGCNCRVCDQTGCFNSPYPVFGPTNWTNWSLPLLGYFTFALDDRGSIGASSSNLSGLIPFCNTSLHSASGEFSWSSIQPTADTAPNPMSAR